MNDYESLKWLAGNLSVGDCFTKQKPDPERTPAVWVIVGEIFVHPAFGLVRECRLGCRKTESPFTLIHMNEIVYLAEPSSLAIQELKFDEHSRPTYLWNE